MLNKKKVELLAPAGNFESFKAAIKAGADAIYLGGKKFNMRRLKADANFDNETLELAVKYAHENNVLVYVTLNNLISQDEIDDLVDYLKFLAKIKVDAVLIQDLAVAQLVREHKIDITMHASIMMNSHNNDAIKKLKEYGIQRVVVSREMSLEELSQLKEIDDDFELEYFVHGDMCISESGQCIHSGVVFANSSNRGRCMKSCRWPYKILDEKTNEIIDNKNDGEYLLALKDMCMYRNIPDLIKAGVLSFKIEGRMRDADFIYRIVSIYRRAIDNYLKDPENYVINEEDWQSLYDNRVRDFSTCFAMDKLDEDDIGYTGEREPRFFSYGTKEADLNSVALANAEKINLNHKTKLVVKVPSYNHAIEAMKSGADILIVGGEVYKSHKAWEIEEIEKLIKEGEKYNCKIIVNTPRTTYKDQCDELKLICEKLEKIKPYGIMVGNIGACNIVNENTTLPIFADHSFNIFNNVACRFLKDNNVVAFTPSYELPFENLKAVIEDNPLDAMLTVHGSIEAMISDSNLIDMNIDYDENQAEDILDKHFALLDTAGGVHSMRVDQYGKIHILFAHDLCVLPYIDKFKGAAMWRIEAQDYDIKLTKKLVSLYRKILDNKEIDLDMELEDLKNNSKRPLGIGIYKHPKSQ